MADFIRRLKDWAVGGQTAENDPYYAGDYGAYGEDDTEFTPLASQSRPKRAQSQDSPSNIVNINNVQMKIETRHPMEMADAEEIRELVKSNVAVVVNLEGTEHKAAQRLVDYLSGVADTVDGDLQCISNRIFVIAPKNVELTGEFKRSSRSDGLSFSFAGDM